MRNNTWCPYFISLVLVALLALLFSSASWMPLVGAMLVLLVATALLAVFAGFVMKEKGGDERDMLHRLNAGRTAYLSGLGVLTFALVVQGLAHDIDPWILLALGVMVLSKVVSHYYSDRYQ